MSFRYRIRDMPADGACLWHCLAFSSPVDGARQSVAYWKQTVGRFIRIHADQNMNRSGVTYRQAIASEFEMDADTAPDCYAQNLRDQNSWGGAIDISAFVDLNRRPVRVYTRAGDRLVKMQDFWPVRVRKLPMIRLLYINDHFSLLIRVQPDRHPP